MRMTMFPFVLCSLLASCDDGEHVHGESCQSIIDACHDVDPGSGPLHDCHETAHAADEAACEPVEAECVAMCMAAASDGGAHDDAGHAHDGGAHAHDGGH